MDSTSTEIVEVLELPGQRRVCKPIPSLEKERGVVEVVSEIAKLLEQFFDVQVVMERPHTSTTSGVLDGEESEIEKDLAPHKTMILKKLT